VTLGNNNGTDGKTDGQTECDAICGPLLKEEGRIITLYRFNQGRGSYYCRGGSNRSRGLSPLVPSL